MTVGDSGTFPWLEADVSAAVAPCQVTLDGRLLFFVASIVGVVQGELAQGGEVTLDAIEPRGPGGRPIEPNVVPPGVGQNRGLAMIPHVVQHDVQRARLGVAPANPLQEGQERPPVFSLGEAADEPVALQVIDAEKVPDPAGAMIGRPQPIYMPAAGPVAAVPGLEIERAEFIDAQPHPAGRATRIQPFEPAVFGPELRVGGFLPGLGVPPADASAPKKLAQPLQRDGGHDLLLDQIGPQLGQRPDAHADELLRGREGHLGDFFDHRGHELAWAERAAEPGIPHDGVDPAVVEIVDDLPHPGRRAACPLGDFAVANAAGREQNDPRVPAVDRAGQLPLHAMQLLAFRRLRPPCHNPVHVLFSTSHGWRQSPEVENIFAHKPPPQQRLRFNPAKTKLSQWKRH